MSPIRYALRPLFSALAALLIPLSTFADTEVVDGIEWTYTISDGHAIIQTANGSSAIAPSTTGFVEIPKILGDCFVLKIGYRAFDSCTKLTSIKIPEGVTSIGDYAFFNCSGLTSVTIPDSITNIGNYAFSGCSGLTSITIPDSVRLVGDYVFSNCSGLSAISIRKPWFTSAVSYSGRNVFWGCSGIRDVCVPGSFNLSSLFPHSYRSITNAVVSDGSADVRNSAFSGCSGLMSVTIQDGVTYIGTSAFSGCSKLTAVTIPDSVTSVGADAFSGCASLTSITIPDGVSTVSDRAFSGCSSLSSVAIPASVTSIRDGAFQGCSGVRNVVVPGRFLLSAVFPDSYQNIMTVAISDGSTEITRKAFYECSQLRVVTIPGGVARIGSFVFSYCPEVTALTLPDGLETIGEYAFSHASGLRTITIPDSVTSIGVGAFFGCANLTSLTIPDSVESVEESAFYGCSGLTSITIPESLVEQTGSWHLPSTCRIDVYPSFVNKDDVRIPMVWIRKNAADIFSSANGNYETAARATAANGVNEVWECYVAGISPTNAAEQFRAQIKFDENGFPVVEWSPDLGDERGYVVEGKATLEDVWGPIDDNSRFFRVRVAMPGGFGDATITFDSAGGSSVSSITTTIGATVSAPAAPTREGYSFAGWRPMFPAKMPLGGATLVAQWTPKNYTITFDSAGGSAVASITAACGSAVAAPADPTKSGCDFAGWSPAFPSTMPPGGAALTAQWLPRNYTITFDSAGGSAVASITAAYGTALAAPAAPTKTGYTFAGWSPAFPATMPHEDAALVAQWVVDTTFFEWTSDGDSATITGVDHDPVGALDIPTTIDSRPVRSIGNSAFYGRSRLTSVTIPDSVTNIGDYAFGQSGLTSVTIPNSVTSIGEGIFIDCSGLTSISIPNSVTSIANCAFESCSGLISITIPDSVICIGDRAFRDCSELTSITIPDYVTNIGRWLFEGCSSLATISIPSHLWNRTSDWNLPSTCQVIVRGMQQNFTIAFDSAGGSAVASITAAYGAAVTEPATPTKEGYTFAGWSPAFPSTMPLGGATLTAQWTAVQIGDFTWTVSGNGITITGCEQTPTGALVIPSEINGHPVTSIGSFAFYGCVEMTSVEIPDSVATIESYAFCGCARLTSVVIPHGVTDIGAWSFCDCLDLASITIADSVTTIGDGAFNDCSSLMSITIPDGVTSIGSVAFEYCPGLATISIPASLQDQVANWSIPSTCQVIVRGTQQNYTITFDSAGGSAVASITAAYGAALTEPAAPTKDGYTFAGWSPAFPTTMPLGGVALTAQWTPGGGIESSSGLEIRYYDIDSSGYSTWTQSESAMVNYFASRTATIETNTLTWGDGLDSGFTDWVSNSSRTAQFDGAGFSYEGYLENLPTNRFAGQYAVNSTESFAAYGVGELTVDQPGEYRFGLYSDDYSVLYIDGVLVASANCYAGTGTINLGTGNHSIRFAFYEIGDAQGVTVQWEKPGDTSYTPIPQSALSHRTGTDTLSFDTNGGTGEMESIEVDRNFGVKLPVCTFTKADMHFIGWATNQAGAVIYADGVFVPPGITTLWAVWSLNPLYLVVDVSSGSGDAAVYPVSGLSVVPDGGWTDEYKTTKIVLRRVDPGSFTMGSPNDEVGRFSNEDRHGVTITKPFYIGVFQVTQGQWESVMGSNPSSYTGDKRPVEHVSYNDIRGGSAGANWPASSEVDATSFLGRLRARATGFAWELPTEAQWEYACRAGTDTALNSGKDLAWQDDDSNMDEVGRYYYDRYDGKGGYSGAHTAVGSYLPNAWGLYDMHGNVLEWCVDRYQEHLGTAEAVDPVGPDSGSYCIRRSGGWCNEAKINRSAYRDGHALPSMNDDANTGFRLAASPSD